MASPTSLIASQPDLRGLLASAETRPPVGEESDATREPVEGVRTTAKTPTDKALAAQVSAAAQPGLATDPARLARTSAGAEAESDRAPQPDSPDSGAVQDQAAEPGVAAPSEPAGVAAGSDPLPTPDQRRAYLHVFIAFGVAWALILGYVVLLGRRIAEARRQFERLRER